MTRVWSKGVLTGLAFIAFGILGWALASGLAVGTGARMGPGYFPRIVSAALMLLGVMRLIAAYRETPEPLDDMHIRPLTLTITAVLAFFFIDSLGLLLAIASVVIVSAFAARQSRPVETVAIAAVLCVFAWLLFVKMLGLAIPVWPGRF